MSAELSPEPPPPPVLSARGLGKRYELYEAPSDRVKELLLPGRRLARPFWALEDVSFEVKEGEASVFKPEGTGYKLVARVQMDDWSKFAAAK